MVKRIVFGALLIALMLGVFWLDLWLGWSHWPTVRVGGREEILHGLPIAALALLLVVAAYRELRILVRAAEMDLSPVAGVMCCLAVASLPFWRQAVGAQWQGSSLTLLLIAGSLMAMFLAQLAVHQVSGTIRRMAGNALALCYLGVCGAIILDIRIEFGLRAFILFVAAVKFTDIGAYFTGKSIGRHKLIPWLSPKKTWEGLGGGVVFGALAAVLVAVAPIPSAGQEMRAMPIPAAACFGALLALFGQGADLCESALKRDAGLKDAGAVVPEFGGILDILDSLLLSAPVAYVLLAIGQ